jgi:hypothetical protein
MLALPGLSLRNTPSGEGWAKRPSVVDVRLVGEAQTAGTRKRIPIDCGSDRSHFQQPPGARAFFVLVAHYVTAVHRSALSVNIRVP